MARTTIDAGPTGRAAPARRRRRLEGIAESFVQRLLECAPVDSDTEVALPVDTAVRGIQQRLGETERVAHAKPHLSVKLTHESKAKEGVVRDSACHASPLADDIADHVLREQIIDPLLRSVYSK